MDVSGVAESNDSVALMVLTGKEGYGMRKERVLSLI
jgi:hypothetical protein